MEMFSGPPILCPIRCKEPPYFPSCKIGEGQTAHRGLRNFVTYFERRKDTEKKLQSSTRNHTPFYERNMQQKMRNAWKRSTPVSNH